MIGGIGTNGLAEDLRSKNLDARGERNDRRCIEAFDGPDKIECERRQDGWANDRECDSPRYLDIT